MLNITAETAEIIMMIRHDLKKKAILRLAISRQKKLFVEISNRRIAAIGGVITAASHRRLKAVRKFWAKQRRLTKELEEGWDKMQSLMEEMLRIIRQLNFLRKLAELKSLDSLEFDTEEEMAAESNRARGTCPVEIADDYVPALALM